MARRQGWRRRGTSGEDTPAADPSPDADLPPDPEADPDVDPDADPALAASEGPVVVDETTAGAAPEDHDGREPADDVDLDGEWPELDDHDDHDEAAETEPDETELDDTDEPDEPDDDVEFDEPDEPDEPDDDVEFDEPDETGGPGDPDAAPTRPSAAARARLTICNAWPVALTQAAHPKQALVTALALGGVAAVMGRPPREAGAVLLTALVGQVMLGWFNDLLDRERDAVLQTPGKPVADGRLEPGTVWYALVIGLLVLIPLTVSTGATAAGFYALFLALAAAGHLVLRRGRWSWLAWALSFACLPAYLTYGGWGGADVGGPPTWQMTALAAALGICVHVLRAVWGLVADNEEGWTYLPLMIGLKIGATRLLAATTTLTVVVVVLMVVTASTVGIRA